ncbi:MAG: CDP-2,3-bis-(O-geranylgeranyl)-sn-glycerol synthase [Methanomicrobia archaeon]|jgi:CDP-2,3-bis-(O-geranylgeranyl)-sn-glycerol synthase|nr:CDP-2,3-bis-(O-geranylgeranyl)-sn-glycerol synthase [Methanomicrobia archaeon]MCK4310692.1 CDP-2,3-bis-(O-geranylgeranyl)-sn-glycerol synthase [Methanomicrobia archaeon]MCK4637314.1 CDP-2,3-bis-(O-geranylgeranyl)-sn-glycerol synthase [Methanomicrobia archaeon]
MNELVSAIWVILPAYIANMTACTFGGGKPLDFNKNFLDGRRLIGNGVTIRGTFVGIFFGTLTCLLQSFFYEYSVPFSLKLGFLLAFGAILGDLVESFLKRRINLERGAPLPLFDQLDFVFGALILSNPLLKLNIRKILTIVLITPILHFSTNYIGYKLKLKEVPW